MKPVLVLVLILQLITTLESVGQIDTEFLVTVDRETGDWDIIDSIPPIRWIDGRYAYDSNNHRYICACKDDDLETHLYSINRFDASVEYDPLFTTFGSFGASLKFSNSESKLYALKDVPDQSSVEFGTLNVESANWTSISIIPDVLNIWDSRFTINENAGQYIFHAKAEDAQYDIYVVDILTGDLLSQTSLPQSFIQGYPEWITLHHDAITDNLYALKHTTKGPVTYGILDPFTANFEALGELAELEIVFNDQYIAFDELNSQFIFMSTQNIWGEDRLCTLDIETGIIEYSVAFPTNLDDPGENVTQLVVDQSDGMILAMHWEFNHVLVNDHDSSEPLFVADSSGLLKYVQFENGSPRRVRVYNDYGQLVLDVTSSNNRVVIETTKFTHGIYCLVIDDGATKWKRKVVL